jgi:tight adherence protein C
MNPLIELGLQFLVFAMVAVLVLVLFRAAERRIAIHRRLMDKEAVSYTAAIVRDEQVRSPLLKGVAAAFLTDPQDRSKLRADLIQAGFTSPTAPVWYVIIRFSVAIGAPMFILVVNGLLGRGSSLNLILTALAACTLGLVGPRMFINGRAKTRRTRIEHQFPDALDLIMVCVEAGLGLESAFLRVGHETQESHPEISHEFGTLADELGAGRTRTDALRAMGERLDVESIKAFVALLVQTEALGVSIAQGLRTYSAEMRETRLLRAEEKALRIPVLMTVPLVACFMPVMLVALLLPPAIDLVRTLLPTLRGQ